LIDCVASIESLGGNAGLAILNSHFLVNLAGYLSFMTNSVVNSPAVGAGSSAAATAAAAGRRMLQLVCETLPTDLNASSFLASFFVPVKHAQVAKFAHSVDTGYDVRC
jgi:hypothetical protein